MDLLNAAAVTVSPVGGPNVAGACWRRRRGRRGEGVKIPHEVHAPREPGPTGEEAKIPQEVQAPREPEPDEEGTRVPPEVPARKKPEATGEEEQEAERPKLAPGKPQRSLRRWSRGRRQQTSLPLSSDTSGHPLWSPHKSGTLAVCRAAGECPLPGSPAGRRAGAGGCQRAGGGTGERGPGEGVRFGARRQCARDPCSGTVARGGVSGPSAGNHEGLSATGVGARCRETLQGGRGWGRGEPEVSSGCANSNAGGREGAAGELIWRPEGPLQRSLPDQATRGQGGVGEQLEKGDGEEPRRRLKKPLLRPLELMGPQRLEARATSPAKHRQGGQGNEGASCNSPREAETDDPATGRRPHSRTSCHAEVRHSWLAAEGGSEARSNASRTTVYERESTPGY